MYPSFLSTLLSNSPPHSIIFPQSSFHYQPLLPPYSIISSLSPLRYRPFFLLTHPSTSLSLPFYVHPSPSLPPHYITFPSLFFPLYQPLTHPLPPRMLASPPTEHLLNTSAQVCSWMTRQLPLSCPSTVVPSRKHMVWPRVSPLTITRYIWRCCEFFFFYCMRGASVCRCG